MAAATVGTIGLEPLLGSRNSIAGAADQEDRSGASDRAEDAAKTRIEAAKAERRVASPPHATNGDEERYADKSGPYTKALLQDGPGRVNLDAYRSFKAALHSGKPEGFKDIIMGGARNLTGPQGGLAFDLAGCDSLKFGSGPAPFCQETVVVVPPAPSLASAWYATELIGLYWEWRRSHPGVVVPRRLPRRHHRALSFPVLHYADVLRSAPISQQQVTYQ